jgi:mannosyltransferase OCH1-like enzyme
MNKNIINRNIQNIIKKNRGKEVKKNPILHYITIKRKLNMPYPLKPYYNNAIPLNIFQTWHTKYLPPLMDRAVNIVKNTNPAFKHYLYDDEDCRNFIRSNFSNEVLNAYDSLIPGAYKADLWRYCILYKLGGIYLDIKYIPVAGFKCINLSEKEHWVLDADKNNIYNALLVCNAGNQILLNAINQIVENVKTKYYGDGSLYPTGPALLARYFTNEEKQKFDMHHEWFKNFDNRFIYFNNYIVFKQYNGYREEHNKNEKVAYYGHLWSVRNIYK